VEFAKLGFNPFSGLPVFGKSAYDVGGNLVSLGEGNWVDNPFLSGNYDDEALRTTQQPSLSAQEQQQREREATARIAQARAEFEATRRDMLIYALSVVIGLVTIFVAKAFF
jgi:hypothetical protein